MRATRRYKSLPFDKALKERAKELRKAGMLHEALMWNELKRGKMNGLDFDRQKIVGSYIVDFYCAEKAVVIEIDGPSHEGKEEYDARRDEFLRGLGLTVIRIEVTSVLQNMEGVVEYLRSHPNLTTPSLRDTPPGEGNCS